MLCPYKIKKNVTKQNPIGVASFLFQFGCVLCDRILWDVHARGSIPIPIKCQGVNLIHIFGRCSSLRWDKCSFFLKDHAASNKLESDRYNSKLILAHLMFKMCNKLPNHDLNAIYIAIQNIRWVFFFWSYILECFLGIERLLA